eukprot:3484797-Amphidinium_carterae.1
MIPLGKGQSLNGGGKSSSTRAVVRGAKTLRRNVVEISKPDQNPGIEGGFRLKQSRRSCCAHH